MSKLRDQVLAVLDDEFRPCADVAHRAGLEPTSAAPVLGHLRQGGLAESRQEGEHLVWRRPSYLLGLTSSRAISRPVHGWDEPSGGTSA
jgi:hypothetical protein